MEKLGHKIFLRYVNIGNEIQNDFLRNTRFQVEKIEQTQETEYKKIYLKELGSNEKPFSGQCLFLRVILSYARSNINNSILQYSLYKSLQMKCEVSGNDIF